MYRKPLTMHEKTNERDYSDPSRTWLIHQRWKNEGTCPLHQTRLRRATIGGRTTAWCTRCQGRNGGTARRAVLFHRGRDGARPSK